ncbi:MAG: LuxR C-terminal-related transcriptional regulator [Nocardioides sp.]
MPRALGLTRVGIVEDHHLFAEALDVALTLEGHDVHRVPLVEPVSTNQLVSAVLRVRPRVALLDLDLGTSADGARLVEPLVRSGIQVVIVTASRDESRWGECLRHGARVVVSKTAPLNTILATIRLIGEGRPVLGHAERERLIATYYRERTLLHSLRDKLELLSGREREVLGQLMAGRQVREIAKRSFVSEATVRTQVKSILSKLEVTSQLAAVGVAHRARWQPPPLRQAG